MVAIKTLNNGLTAFSGKPVRVAMRKNSKTGTHFLSVTVMNDGEGVDVPVNGKLEDLQALGRKIRTACEKGNGQWLSVFVPAGLTSRPAVDEFGEPKRRQDGRAIMNHRLKGAFVNNTFINLPKEAPAEEPKPAAKAKKARKPAAKKATTPRKRRAA